MTSKAWIAAPVIGGIAILAGFALFFYLSRRKKESRQQSRQAQDVPLSFLSAIKTNGQRLASKLSHRSNAGFSPSTPSQTSLESGNSDDALYERQ
jgi:flagellar basal body-associated protein FliL